MEAVAGGEWCGGVVVFLYGGGKATPRLRVLPLNNKKRFWWDGMGWEEEEEEEEDARMRE